ncbi:hypothetical protein CPB86DRAFT_58985 [Serendipita vermifera]|nr:hypothetical protein CPB86DRAFT_58985 [Serendipita vermifera]
MQNNNSKKRSLETRSTDDIVEPPSRSKKARYDIKDPARKSNESNPVVNLASATRHQDILDQLPAGAIFELARVCISQGKDPSELDRKWLRSLQTAHTNSLALIASYASAKQTLSADTTIAQFLDWEADAIVKGDGTTLECQPTPEGVQEGLVLRSGRVIFSATLNVPALIEASISQTKVVNASSSADSHPFFSLKPLRMGDSSLFTRVFGSHRFLRVTLMDRNKDFSNIPTQEKANILLRWLKRPLNIFGRAFRAFTIKDDVVWYFLEGKDRLGAYAQSRNRIEFGRYGVGLTVGTIEQLVEWWIPLDANGEQLICKLVSRFHLGISNTLPGPLLHKEDEIEWIDDIKRNDVVFTDGCGLISHKWAQKHQQKSVPDDVISPAAYQIRIGTAKGVLQKVPESMTQEMGGKAIKITRSMVKAVQPKLFIQPRDGPSLLKGLHILDAAHRVTCIVKASKWSYPARLSSQLIPILVQQGVPQATIRALQKAKLQVIFDELMKPLCLSETLSDRGKLSFAKAIQTHGSLIYRCLVEDQASSTTPHLAKMRRNYRTVEDIDLENIIALTPEEEAGLEAADLAFCESQQLYLAALCGLDILSSEYFTKLWKRIIRHCAMSSILAFHIEVEESAYCMILPDFSGVLPEGYISFTPPEQVCNAGFPSDFTSGHVLVARHPALLLTDIQKVQLANIPSLRNRTGVIFFSTQGERPLADLLGGGDYDGDTAIIIWNKEIVDQFSNADLLYSKVPDSVSTSFEKDETTARNVFDQIQRTPKSERLSILQDYLLASIKVDPNLLNKYSRMHLKAVHEHGITSEEARCIAHKFMTVMDTAKSALQLTSNAKRADGQKYDTLEDPLWKQEKDKHFYHRRQAIGRNDRALLHTDIDVLTRLWKKGTSSFKGIFDDYWKAAVAKGKVTYNASQHKKLLLPTQKASILAENSPTTYGKQWNIVKGIVHQCYDEFLKMKKDAIKQKEGKHNRKAELIRIIQKFNSTPLVSEVENLVGDQDHLDELKASYAFFHDIQRSNRRGHEDGFPWLMSFSPLLSLLNSNRRQAIPIPVSTLKRLTPHNSFLLNG